MEIVPGYPSWGYNRRLGSFQPTKQQPLPHNTNCTHIGTPATVNHTPLAILVLIIHHPYMGDMTTDAVTMNS